MEKQVLCSSESGPGIEKREIIKEEAKNRLEIQEDPSAELSRPIFSVNPEVMSQIHTTQRLVFILHHWGLEFMISDTNSTICLCDSKFARYKFNLSHFRFCIVQFIRSSQSVQAYLCVSLFKLRRGLSKLK